MAFHDAVLSLSFYFSPPLPVRIASFTLVPINAKTRKGRETHPHVRICVSPLFATPPAIQHELRCPCSLLYNYTAIYPVPYPMNDFLFKDFSSV